MLTTLISGCSDCELSSFDVQCTLMISKVEAVALLIVFCLIRPDKVLRWWIFLVLEFILEVDVVNFSIEPNH